MIARAVMQAEDGLLKINKSQMLASKDSEGKPLVHRSTGSEYLTHLYAIRTGKMKPNLYLTGAFQRDMFLEVNENDLTWFIDSYDQKSGILTDNYTPKIFGVEDKDRAKRLTSIEFKQLYERTVLR